MKLSAYRLDYGIALCFGLLLIANLIASKLGTPLNVESYQLSDKFHTPLRTFEITNNESRDSSKIAVLLHGFRCSGSLMIPLAKQIADLGYKVYVPDLPGHGRSEAYLPLIFSNKANGQASAPLDLAPELIQSILRHRASETRELLLIGHSWGAHLLQDVSPSSFAVPNVKRVMIDGPLFNPSIEGQVYYLFSEQDAKANNLDSSYFQNHGDTVGTISNTSHMGIVTSSEAVQKIANWTQGESSNPNGEIIGTPNFNVLGVTQFILISILLILLLLKLSKTPYVSTSPEVSLKYALGTTVVAALVSRGVIWEWPPSTQFSALRLLGQMPYVYLAIFGVLALVGLWLRPNFRLTIKWPGVSEVYLGTGAFLLTYLLVGPFAADRFLHLDLSMHLIPRMLLLSLGLFPIAFFASIGASRFNHPIKSYAIQVAIWTLALLLWAWHLSPRAQREAAEILGLIATLEALAGIISIRAPSIYVGSIYVSLTLSWIVTALYPRF